VLEPEVVSRQWTPSTCFILFLLCIFETKMLLEHVRHRHRVTVNLYRFECLTLTEGFVPTAWCCQSLNIAARTGKGYLNQKRKAC
jgi:hypothetical protein